jgi:hypothetical protein
MLGLRIEPRPGIRIENGARDFPVTHGELDQGSKKPSQSEALRHLASGWPLNNRCYWLGFLGPKLTDDTYLISTWICFGLASSFLGTKSRSTPSLNSALIASTFALGESVNERKNLP